MTDSKSLDTKWKQQHVKVGVGTLVFRKGEEGELLVLLGKRKNSHGAGKYALPGGHLELGEALYTCASRELEEETGLKADPKAWSFAFVSNDVMVADSKHYITIFLQFFDASKQEVLNREPHKCEKWEWLSFKELKSGKIVKPEQMFVPLKNMLINSNFNPNVETVSTQRETTSLCFMGK
eukprot:CAMPEP_0184489928 /NCGR_PEP_ID=MMETSP0113_2-20130426/16672_1 /TAXON_ID=91329 /ORGANISM="Norrisiella sphaerica, Strain BC52" /LENGTH=179 /DNA_ID=CAMNT_0026873597 /DNA_START=198 /DNA_END=737 /DNA_ORIENTATION=+